MNITIYKESFDWLFTPRGLRADGIWSFGRHPPPVEIGDDLIFRQDGKPLARAICRQIYKPGERDVMQHDGSRELKGWKVLWYQYDFEDFRALHYPKIAFTEVTVKMREALVHASRVEDGMVDRFCIGATWNGLTQRRLINYASKLTVEGWRTALRFIGEFRQIDIEGGFPCCRICGCTDHDACEEGCSWTDESFPPLCSACRNTLAGAGVLDLLPPSNIIKTKEANA